MRRRRPNPAKCRRAWERRPQPGLTRFIPGKAGGLFLAGRESGWSLPLLPLADAQTVGWRH